MKIRIGSCLPIIASPGYTNNLEIKFDDNKVKGK